MKVVEDALKEDIGRGDVTVKALVPKDAKTRAVIVAREPGVIAGLKVAKGVFAAADRRIRFVPKVKDGDRVRKGKVLAQLTGPARGVLIGERVALNFLGHLSGIATLTAKFVKAARKSKVKIMDTRKTVPGLRVLEKYAVKLGGGVNHRMGLWDQVLIKENHLGVRCSVFGVRCEEAIREAVKQAKKKVPRRMKVEVEVNSLREFRAALEAKPDIIMLDNMRLNDIRIAVKLRNTLFRKPKTETRKPLLEVSGNVTLNNVARIAATGVDRISIGALTHSAPALDVALEIYGKV